MIFLIFRALSTGTKLYVTFFLDSSVSPELITQIANKVNERIDTVKCITLGDGCVPLLQNTDIVDGTQEGQLMCVVDSITEELYIPPG